MLCCANSYYSGSILDSEPTYFAIHSDQVVGWLCQDNCYGERIEGYRFGIKRRFSLCSTKSLNARHASGSRAPLSADAEKARELGWIVLDTLEKSPA